jgi:hypothetical protein
MTVVDSCIIKEQDTFYIDAAGKEPAELGGVTEGDTIKFHFEGKRYIGKVEKFEHEEKDLYILKNVQLIKTL